MVVTDLITRLVPWREKIQLHACSIVVKLDPHSLDRAQVQSEEPISDVHCTREASPVPIKEEQPPLPAWVLRHDLHRWMLHKVHRQRHHTPQHTDGLQGLQRDSTARCPKASTS